MFIEKDICNNAYDTTDFEKFVYSEYHEVTPHLIRLMILKSEWMMTKYLYERVSKWTSE